jgi:hypothetical protein
MLYETLKTFYIYLIQNPVGAPLLFNDKLKSIFTKKHLFN